MNPITADFLVLDTPTGSWRLPLGDLRNMGASISVGMKANVFEEQENASGSAISHAVGPHSVTITIEVEANFVRYEVAETRK